VSTQPVTDPLDPAFVHGLDQLTLDELRRRRDVANERETQYSYVRRMVQGPLDILDAEVARRTAGQPSGDVSDLVERLPSILGDQIHAPGLGRLPAFLAPGAVDDALTRRLDAIVTTDELADLASLDDARVAAIGAALRDFEREVSDTRRSLQEVVDQVKGELIRRYRDGEAPPEAPGT